MSLTKEQVLKQYYGYNAFRPLQADIIDWVLYGQDAMVLMPTGGGKSLCFQIPALMMQGLTLVISPLIALMHDQVQALKANGIAAEYVNSSLTTQEQSSIERQCRNGELKLLYISPEKLFTQGYLEWVVSLNISLFAIDESHCVSTWGHDFRPEYTKLNVLKKALPNVPMIALTATADKVTRKDILAQLGIPDAKVFISSFDRPNLSLAVQAGRNRVKIIQNFIAEHPRQCGIIYCLSRKNTESVAEALQKVGINAKCYHAGMPAHERSSVQNQFIQDDIQVIVATIAFGMGIDKSNVRWVIHYSMPSNVESFYQEIGRAGRDGLKSDTLLFYSYNDLLVRKDMIATSELPAEMKEVQVAKVERMKQYAEAEICRRRILLSYFNEEVTTDCGNCDVCKNPPIRFDATLIAQKALSAIARTGENIAMSMLIDILRGSNNRRIIEHKYHEIKTFGAGKELKADEWADYLQQMLNSGVMDIAYDEAHAYKLNKASWAILKEGRKVQLVRYRPFEEKQAEREANIPKEKSKKEVIKDALFERLRVLRKQIADDRNIPPFVVFSDATLSDMAQKKPLTQLEIMNVSGVGEQKYRQFGEAFLLEIRNFLKTVPKGSHATGIDTHHYTFQLYKEGFSVEEIAEQRNLNPVTIFSHLAKLYEDGENIDISAFITQAEYEQIMGAAKVMNVKKGDPIKPLFEAMDAKYEYHKIRIALLISEKVK
ncbi:MULTISPECIES: DNA helicase RecQ [unclassified Arcicella]|uniref:DNA helicase RecQ n=1 Tax=unclassified Arcicella TaxID=2644986 RepID=UPI00285912D0|nr:MULTISPECIES: DNA helicase RecQ [unclassified Arcicella]MDR6563380.1 ATP-dependent DNA helicase RecQ [Arcicella sp. BE51]MDR6813199.1 ATP-dependent DNA helicase RecQ [Arcicella sp. BE140]MDR6824513.1 ATP-dependent DNA helicase RecQ [Arcicella sp. BE139]